MLPDFYKSKEIRQRRHKLLPDYSMKTGIRHCLAGFLIECEYPAHDFTVAARKTSLDPDIRCLSCRICAISSIFGKQSCFACRIRRFEAFFGSSWPEGAARKNREKIEGRFAAGGRAASEVLAIVRLHGIMNTVIGHGFAGR